MSDDTTSTPDVAPEFANVPAEELQKYLDDSGLRPGEDHDAWAMRNRMAREKLLVAYPVSNEQ